LEYYQYHSDRDSLVYTVRLGRLFYFGSVYFLPGGISSGGEGVGEIPQDYRKAKEYFLRAARQLWPTDFDSEGKVMPKRKMSKEQEDSVRDPATIAAGFLGRMSMRGEGGKEDWRRGRMWLERAAELVSHYTERQMLC
jgi:SEL1 protein